MNKKGQVVFYGLMLSVALIVLILGMLPAGQNFINDAMNESTATFIGMDCGNQSISNFDKGTCTILDFSSAYVFGGFLLIALGVVTAKIAFSSGGND